MDGIEYVYILAPITGLVAVAVIAYITVQSRKLRREMISRGQLVGVVPTVITVNNQTSINHVPREDIRSPDGLPAPPPYSKY